MKIEYCTYLGTSKIQHMECKMEFRWNFEVLYNTFTLEFLISVAPRKNIVPGKLKEKVKNN